MENQDADLATDGGEEDRFADLRLSKPWLQSIKEAETYYQKYNETCDKIDKLYAHLETMSGVNTERQFQIFWANLEVLKPIVYSRAPAPVVVSRFKDRKPLNKHASEMLERTIITSFDTEDIHVTLKHVRDDLTISGRGVVWCRYEADDDGQERIAYDHVDRRDFLMQEARKWRECGWVARRSYLDRDQMKFRFEETSGNAYLQANFKEDKENVEDYAGTKKAEVWELWSRDQDLVVWVTEGVEEVLDISEPFLSLENFYPCPRPAFGTIERNTLKPVPDFVYYKDQVEEINELTARISALSEALRVKGFYAGGNEDLGDAIEAVLKQQDNNAVLVPVPNMSSLGGGRLSDAIVWLPLDVVAATVQQLVALRRQLIEDVYEITGLSDIMRGATEASETLGAQQLKSQFGATRIRDKQEEMARIAKDCAIIAGEIMAENFQPQTIIQMSQYEEIKSQAQIQQQVQQLQQQLAQGQQQVAQAAQDPEMVRKAQENPEQAQQLVQQVQQQAQQIQQQIQELGQEITFEAVFELYRNERMRPFILDIETDSTIQPDEDAAKQRTTEFLGALSTALAQLSPMVQAQPQSAPFAGEVLKFAVAPFRAGRELEGAIDEFTEKMKEAAAQPKPDPEAAKAQMEQAKLKADMEAKQAAMQFDQQQAQIEAQIKQKELELKTAEGQQKLDLDRQKLELEAAKLDLERQRAVQDAEFKERDFDERGIDREEGRKQKFVEAGIPPDYSFEDDRKQFSAIMERVEQSDAAVAQMVSVVSENQTAIAEALGGLSQALTAPTEIVRGDDGKAIGSRKVVG